MGSMNQTILSKTPVQMRHVRHADLQEGTEAYPYVMGPARRRSISHVLGQHPKAVLRDSYKFHLDYLVAGAATEPPLHSHDYSEIFMVLQGGYRFFWGNHAEHHVDLGPLDMFSVPPKVMRKFHSNREQRSEEHTSELQSLMRTSYAVFCLKKNNTQNI